MAPHTPRIMATPCAPPASSDGRSAGVTPPIATTGTAEASQTALRKVIPRSASPGCEAVSNTCPATSQSAPSAAAKRASADECTLAPSLSAGATRRASATVIEREVNWTPRAPAASATSRRSLMTSQHPVRSCTVRSVWARANSIRAGARCPRRCTAPRAPNASITAVARRGKSESSRISGVVTA